MRSDNIKLVIWREFLLSLRNRKFYATIIAQAILMLIFGLLQIVTGRYIGLGFFFPFIFVFPLIWVGILASIFSADLISGERESGTLELLMLGPMSIGDLIAGKIVFCLIQYLLFTVIYLSSFLIMAWFLGWYLLKIAVVLLFGPYLLSYLVLIVVIMNISSLLKSSSHSVAIGIGLAIATIIFNALSPLTHGYFRTYNPIFWVTLDMMFIQIGSYPDPTIWGSMMLALLGFLGLLYLSVKRLWGGLKE